MRKLQVGQFVRRASVAVVVAVFFSWCGGVDAQIQDSAGIPVLPDYTSHRSSSFARNGSNADYIEIAPGQTSTIFDTDGPSEIRHIWITISNPGWYHLKEMVIRMYWDNEPTPSVEAPIGDFFGLGLGEYHNYQSSMITVAPEKALNSYFRMPFAHHGKITITNEGKTTADAFYYNIDYVHYNKPLPADTIYFHAQYRQCTPCKGWFNDWEQTKEPRIWAKRNVDGKDNYVFLEAKGKGMFVGDTLSVVLQQRDGWNEGDDMFFIDGATIPSIQGTGGEDYFCSAWGFSTTFSYPYCGLVEFTGYEAGDRSTHYRWHTDAPIAFQKDLKVTIEDGHANHRSDSFFSVAYWYQTEPHAKFPKLPPVEERIPKLIFVGGPGQVLPK